jgi:hypothetical protein
MSLREHHKANFNTMLLAAKNGDLALLDCRDKKTGKQVHVACAVHQEPDGEYHISPFAKLFDGDPYEEVDPPARGGGYEG